MSTDPREFEHPIDGTGGNVPAPNVLELGAMALFDDNPVWHLVHDRPALWGEVVDSAKERYRQQARSVLAAISEAGAVEWGVFRITDAPVMRPFDEAKFTTKTAAEVFIKLGFLERVAKTLEPRSRITGPWEVVG